MGVLLKSQRVISEDISQDGIVPDDDRLGMGALLLPKGQVTIIKDVALVPIEINSETMLVREQQILMRLNEFAEQVKKDADYLIPSVKELKLGW